MLRPHRSAFRNFSLSTQLTIASGITIAASLLSACSFGPRDPESAPDNRGDEIAEASAHEGEKKVDKDGFRTPDAQPVREDAPPAPEAGQETSETTDSVKETMPEAEEATKSDGDAKSGGKAKSE